jgi:hypothetical protein
LGLDLLAKLVYRHVILASLYFLLQIVHFFLQVLLAGLDLLLYLLLGLLTLGFGLLLYLFFGLLSFGFNLLRFLLGLVGNLPASSRLTRKKEYGQYPHQHPNPRHSLMVLSIAFRLAW